MRLTNKASFNVRKHTVTTAGTPEHLGGYIVAATISFATNVITDSGSGFVAKGFKTGDTITVSGASNAANNDTFTNVTVAAGTITLDSGVVLTTESASATITISEIDRVTQDVDDGVSVAIRANPTNTGYVYVGNSATNALPASNNNQPLWLNSVCKMQIKDLRAIWVDAANSGDSVIYQYEV